MAKKKEVYKVKPLNENKKNIIAALIDEYDIETADDIQAALKDLLGGTIKSMMEAEMDEHLGYGSYERSEGREPGDNYRNGTDVTYKILQDIDDWQNRPLDEIYPIMFIDAVHFSVREDNRIKKLAAYVILAITLDGRKDVISLQIGENESSKYWLGVLNELKNRGVKDVMIICADGLTGIKEAIGTAFPDTEYQRCIVHQVRNTLKYVPYKDMKVFAADLKTIYLAPSEEQGRAQLERVTEKWEPKYPNAMKSWTQNWDVISPIFKFSNDVIKVIYTTNAIESLNSTYKKLNRQRSVFPSDKALLKALYLSTLQATKKWSQPLRNWGKVYGEFAVMYEGRIPS